MEISAVNDWLGSERNYAIGRELYNRFGDNAYLKTLFEKENAYTRVKIAEELAKLPEEQQRQTVVIKVRSIYPHEDYKRLPTEVQDIIAKAKQLFKENATRQDDLYAMYERDTYEKDEVIFFKNPADQLKCAIITNTIKDVEVEIEVLYGQIAFYETNKVLPVSEPTAFDASGYTDAYEVEKMLQSARQYISKHKNNPLKENQVKAKQDEKLALERRKLELI